MDKRLLFVLFAVLGSILILCCCSQVFEAGISGKVVTEVGTDSVAVSDVNVFAYTDKGARDSDYEEFKAGTRTRPSEKAGYVATTTTNANGEFVVNKIVWETKKSKYGKTADVNKLYLIFYHENYDVITEDATVISDSTNQSNVYVTLKGNKDYTTLNITVFDVSTGRAMDSSATLSYWVNAETSSDPDTVVVTGNTSVRIAYAKGTIAKVTMYLESNGTKWVMSEKDGKVIADKTKAPSFNVNSLTSNVNLYMKNFEFTLPGFSGGIDGEVVPYTDTSKDVFDNVPVWLAYKGTDDNWYPFKETIDANTLTYATQIIASTSVLYVHGEFSGVGNSSTVTVNKDSHPLITDWDSFTGKNLTVTLGIFTGEYTGPGNYDGYSFSYTPEVSSTALGTIVRSSMPVL
ncbi:MAG: hypothetical protein J6W39_06870 [Spirochaetales bacterium]|nr:hypothetical protein [Spirochaetales bacterium]